MGVKYDKSGKFGSKPSRKKIDSSVPISKKDKDSILKSSTTKRYRRIRVRKDKSKKGSQASTLAAIPEDPEEYPDASSTRGERNIAFDPVPLATKESEKRRKSKPKSKSKYVTPSKGNALN